jgi:ABC-2 type transport system permease protein
VKQFTALYDLIVKSQATRARLLLLGALGVVGILIAFAIGQSDSADKAGTQFVNTFGLSLVVPVTTLVFASAALGDFIDDGTMVYLWLRPVQRWKLAIAAAASSFTVVLPLVLVPLTIAAAATGKGNDLVVGTMVSATVGIAAYTGLFVTLGVRVRRSLLWGLLYIFVWEGFVARAGETASRLAICSYTRSILSDATGFELRLADVSPAYRYIVPIAVLLASLAYASRRLQVQDVA